MNSYNVIFRFQKIYEIYDVQSKEEAIKKAKEKFDKRIDESENIPDEEFDIIVDIFR